MIGVEEVVFFIWIFRCLYIINFVVFIGRVIGIFLIFDKDGFLVNVEFMFVVLLLIINKL